MDAKPTQHIETTHQNVNLKLAFHKAGSFHSHYLTFTPQTYHHPVHRIRSWHTQMTSPSHPHKHECSQEIYTTIHTESFCLGKTNNLILNQDKTTCILFTPDLAEYTSIRHTHSKHLSTCTHTFTNHKSTHCNRMG